MFQVSNIIEDDGILDMSHIDPTRDESVGTHPPFAQIDLILIALFRSLAVHVQFHRVLSCGENGSKWRCVIAITCDSVVKRGDLTISSQLIRTILPKAAALITIITVIWKSTSRNKNIALLNKRDAHRSVFCPAMIRPLGTKDKQ